MTALRISKKVPASGRVVFVLPEQYRGKMITVDFVPDAKLSAQESKPPEQYSNAGWLHEWCQTVERHQREMGLPDEPLTEAEIMAICKKARAETAREYALSGRR